MRVPELNADLGEGMGNDLLILPYVHRANLACGGHAGGSNTLRTVMDKARQLGKRCGAHPGYADPDNFGRVSLKLSFKDLSLSLLEQLSAFDHAGKAAGIKVSHVKFHGALYNDAARDRQLAKALARLVFEHYGPIEYMGLSGSCMLEAAAEAGLQPLHEVFADRHYQDDGSLMPRSRPEALIHDIRECLDQLAEMVEMGRVKTPSGYYPIRVDTICIHGDGPEAETYAKAIYQYLETRNASFKKT